MSEIIRAIVAFLQETVRNPGDNLLAVFLLALVAVAVLVLGIGKGLDAFAKIIGYIASGVGGAKTWVVDRRQRQSFLNRKKQFLRMLESDLAGIAKSEAWNDQHFTDLEAEVEIEGEYYASPFKRLIRKKSSGLRRLPSLMRALDESPDKCLLLVGDPGAGKSVALRHLAHQIIERAKVAKDVDARVPLYVNLREFVPTPGAKITVDQVKKFVIDNVRRGDADTAEYISENWKEFQEKGVWTFLFDSFDEIPAVLHSAAGEQIVAEYSAAIRQFMDGLGGCRGIVASREYKSPRALQWSKLRILPLSEERQEELVSRTFLSSEGKQTVLRHLSSATTTTFRNPLFLTLLCRHVKEFGVPPVSEHELLLNHVASLSRRDSAYVAETWGLSPADLLLAAKEVARLFAIDSNLGLSPTFADVTAAAGAHGVLVNQDVQKILDALSYVKIGRTDVQSSELSVRRFAFGHRRYQESLFAKMLIEDPAIIAVEKLVVDPRWREYAVAILQVGSGEASRRILEFSSSYLAARLKSMPLRSRNYFGMSVTTYHWGDEELTRVLALLQEGLQFSAIEEFEALAQSINAIANPLWTRGDHYDRLQVMRLCSAVRPDDLVRRVESATASGIEPLEEAGIQAGRYVSSPTKRLADWVRKHVLARLVMANRRFEFLRWEAIAAELPSAFEISATMGRMRQLVRAKKVLFLYWLPIDFLLRGVPQLIERDQRVGGHVAVLRQVSLISGAAAYFVALVVGAVLGLSKDGFQFGDVILLVPLVLLVLYLIRCMLQVRFISFPGRLGVRHVAQLFAGMRLETKGTVRGLVALAVIGLVPGAVVWSVAWIFGRSGALTWQVFPICSAVLVVAVGILAMAQVALQERKSLRSAVEKVESGKALCEIISSAGTSDEVAAACVAVANRDGWEFDDVRRAVSMLTCALRAIPRGRGKVDWLRPDAYSNLKRSLSVLLMLIDKRAGS